MPGLGKPLSTSAFVESKTDPELVAFIKTGRPLWDAANTTGLDMPPKGGNPALSDDEIDVIVSFIRAIQK
jgi:disulfide bond formation protein DsbB